MPDMDLVTTIPRTPLGHRMAWIVASLLFVFGSWLIGHGVGIHVKAIAAQWLLHHAWQETLTTQQPIKPWPWADTWPVGRLLVPRLGINQIILANASGQSLAFGPGKVGNGSSFDDDSFNLIVSGHRDTHFSFVQDLQLGDLMTFQTIQGDWRRFVAETIEVVDSRIDTLPLKQKRPDLRLITCYPFDAIRPGGPLRYVVTAGPVTPRVVSETGSTTIRSVGAKGRGMIVEGG